MPVTSCFYGISSCFRPPVRLKVTVKKWGAMRQSIDLNRKKEQRGAVVTVMFHGSVWHFDDSLSAVLAPSCAPEYDSRARCLPGSVVEAVAIAPHSSLDAERRPLSAAADSVFAVVSQSKIPPWAMSSRLSAFQVEGISNSSCDYAACIPTIQNPEQRCCAAA